MHTAATSCLLHFCLPIPSTWWQSLRPGVRQGTVGLLPPLTAGCLPTMDSGQHLQRPLWPGHHLLASEVLSAQMLFSASLPGSCHRPFQIQVKCCPYGKWPQLRQGLLVPSVTLYRSRTTLCSILSADHRPPTPASHRPPPCTRLRTSLRQGLCAICAHLQHPE